MKTFDSNLLVRVPDLEQYASTSSVIFVLSLHSDVSLIQNDHAVPPFGNDMLVCLSSIHIKIHVVCWGSSFQGALDVENFSGHHFRSDPILIVEGNFIRFILLVVWVTIFVFSLQIDPKLETV